MKCPTVFVVSALAVTCSAGQVTYCLPGDACYPAEQAWSEFNKTVNGRLIKNVPYAAACYKATYDAAKCREVITGSPQNVWRSSQPAGVMYTNWEQRGDETGGCLPPAKLNGDGSLPAPLETPCDLGAMSTYSVNATSAADIAKAVAFAAKNKIRLRIKNSGHCYTGRSTGEGSFAIWTHHLTEAKLIQDFVPEGASSSQPVLAAQPGVNVGQLYQAGADNKVVTIGGFTPSVGAAGGYIVGGGTGPLGPVFGLGVDNVVQFDIVTADGKQGVANEKTNPDLFWALRGGGGAFAVTTRVYLKAHRPFAAVNTVWGTVKCSDQSSFQGLISNLIDLQVPARNANHTGIWQTAPSTLSLAHLAIQPIKQGDTIVSPQETLSYYEPLFTVPGCTASANGSFTAGQTTGDSSWNDAYKTGVLPLINAAANVGMPLIDNSRLISYSMIENAESTQRLKEYIGNTKVPFIWQNSNGNVATEVATDATPVHPEWRTAFAFMDQPIFGPHSGLNETQFAMQTRVEADLDSLFGTATYYNEQWFPQAPGEGWQDRFWGSNYDRLLSIKKEVDPSNVFGCRTCVGSESGF